MRALTLTLGCLAVLLLGQATAGGDYLSQFEVPADAEYVGSEDCSMCHEEPEEFYAHSPHAAMRGLTIPGTDISGCEACHGPGSVHMDEGGEGWILGSEQLGALSKSGYDAMCLQCHTQMDVHHATSNHHDEVSCAECHADQAHWGGIEAQPAKAFRNQAEFCLQCHPATTAQFRLPHRHRVLEGHLTCTDCHDPHRGQDFAGWDGVNETCLGCHAEIAGPHVFEHLGVEGEECLSCHRPHGSHHANLLNQDGNSLCLQCHYETAFTAEDNWRLGGVPHGGLLAGEARCTDCHREIRGSNVSPAFAD
jgi:DmsE family decaheme c-type cytochrome